MAKFTAKYLYTYNNTNYYGWRSIVRCLKYQGYSKISQKTVERLAEGYAVKGYEDLHGKITRRPISVPTYHVKEADNSGTNSQ